MDVEIYFEKMGGDEDGNDQLVYKFGPVWTFINNHTEED